MRKIHGLIILGLFVSCTLIPLPMDKTTAPLTFFATPLNEYGTYEGYNLSLGTTAAHRANAPKIRPVNGKIVMVAVGASVPNQIAERIEERTVELTNPYFNFVNLAQPARDISDWLNDSDIWDVVDSRLIAEGVLNTEVQVAWFQNDLLLTDTAYFPEWPEMVQDSMEALIAKLRVEFPKLKQVYISGRLYTGWGFDIKHTEPKGYYNGWAARWVVESQINLETPAVPWICDDLYMWANGETPRIDGFQILESDFKTDKIHLTSAGKQKYGDYVFEEFLIHPVASKFFY